MFQQDRRYQQNDGAGARWFSFSLLIILILAIAIAVSFYYIGFNVASQNDAQKINDLTDQNKNLTKKLDDVLQTNQRVVQAQMAEALKGLVNTVNAGLIFFFVAASIPLPVWVVSQIIATQKLGTASVEQPEQPSRPVQPARRKPSPAAQKAREVERQTGQKQPNHIEFLYTRPFWPENDKSEERISDDHPWAN